MELKVIEKTRTATDAVRIRLADPRGAILPAFKPGAHIAVTVARMERRYSLTSSPETLDHHEICVLRARPSRGGSDYIHDRLNAGETLTASNPINGFPLRESAGHSVFIAGGIGITPFYSMMASLHRAGLETMARAAPSPCRPALTAARHGGLGRVRAGTERRSRPNQKTHPKRRTARRQNRYPGGSPNHSTKPGQVHTGDASAQGSWRSRRGRGRSRSAGSRRADSAPATPPSANGNEAPSAKPSSACKPAAATARGPSRTPPGTGEPARSPSRITSGTSFFDARSFRTALSSIVSASSFLSFAFSSSGARSRLPRTRRDRHAWLSSCKMFRAISRACGKPPPSAHPPPDPATRR